MLTVHKIPLQFHDDGYIEMHRPLQPVLVGYQNDELYLWLKVDTKTNKTGRLVLVTGTGHQVPSRMIHCGSAISSGGFVWHVWMAEYAFGVET